MVSALELRRQVQDSGQRGRHLPSRHHALDREAAPLLDQLPVSVVREIEALQLGSRRRWDEAPVLGHLLIGQEFDWHAG